MKSAGGPAKQEIIKTGYTVDMPYDTVRAMCWSDPGSPQHKGNQTCRSQCTLLGIFLCMPVTANESLMPTHMHPKYVNMAASGMSIQKRLLK